MAGTGRNKEEWPRPRSALVADDEVSSYRPQGQDNAQAVWGGKPHHRATGAPTRSARAHTIANRQKGTRKKRTHHHLESRNMVTIPPAPPSPHVCRIVGPPKPLL